MVGLTDNLNRKFVLFFISGQFVKWFGDYFSEGYLFVGEDGYLLPLFIEKAGFVYLLNGGKLRKD